MFEIMSKDSAARRGGGSIPPLPQIGFCIHKIRTTRASWETSAVGIFDLHLSFHPRHAVMQRVDMAKQGCRVPFSL